MSTRAEQLGLEELLVIAFGEQNRLKIRKVIQENTPELKGAVTQPWRKEFALLVLSKLRNQIEASQNQSERSDSEQLPSRNSLPPQRDQKQSARASGNPSLQAKLVVDHGIGAQHTTIDAMRSGRILVVHHEHPIAEFICQFLVQEGYETRTECSSADAINTAGEFAPQLLIIDPVMPAISGLDAARQISDRTKCKVLLVSTGARDNGFTEILNDLQNQGYPSGRRPH